MRIWRQQEVLLAPGGEHAWASSDSWQRGWGDLFGDANAPLYVVTPRTQGPLTDGDRAVLFEQRTVGFDGAISAPRVLTRVVLPLAGLDAPDWAVGFATGLSATVYGAITTTLDENRAVDLILQRAPDPFSPLDGGVALLADLPLDRLLDVNTVIRDTYVAAVHSLREADGTVTVQFRAFDPTTVEPLNPSQTIASLPDTETFWRLDDWSAIRVLLLSETAGHDLRVQTFRTNGQPNAFNRDYVVPLGADELFFATEDFNVRLPDVDVLLTVGDRVGGVAGVRVILGDDESAIVPSGTFTIRQQARFTVANPEPVFAFREINHDPSDPRFADLLFYYLDGANAFARIYDLQSNSFETPLLIAEGVTEREFGGIIDYDDGRFLLSYTADAPDGLTSASLGRIIDVRDASAVVATGGLFVGSAFDDVMEDAVGDSTLAGGAGDDRFTAFLRAGGGRDVVIGGDGTDTAELITDAGQTTLARFRGEVVALLPELGGGVGSERFTEVEQFVFSDGALAVPGADFAALAYVASYGDLIAAFGPNATAGWEHYVGHGFGEGRGISFEGLRYIASHADLIAVLGADAESGARHFIEFGRAEGRGVAFEALSYVASYADLIAAFGADEGAATAHYIQNGFREGRSASFDALRYLASHSDLRGAFGFDTEAATRHYVTFGFREGRGLTFDPQSYVAANADLLDAFGADAASATLHFLNFGVFEGRDPSFDALDYIASHPDLIAAFGADPAAGLAHWLNHGTAEGRAADTFDGAQYLANYPDLQAAFGADEIAAARHFIQFGFAEGRIDAIL